MRKITCFLAATLIACAAMAAPPYNIELVVNAPVDGGPVDSYEFFINDESQGQVNVGLNSFPNMITADGTYTFRVDATNGAGTTPGQPVTVTVNELSLPGTTTIQIQVDCDPCVTTQQ